METNPLTQMMLGTVGALLGLSVIVAYAGYANAELTPPYFNLAEGRKISASATCGVDTDGPELYCKLVGAKTKNDHQFSSLIQGQVRNICWLQYNMQTFYKSYFV